MKSSEYYEHQLNEEQLRSDQLQDQIDTLKFQLDDLKAERKELVEALNKSWRTLTEFGSSRDETRVGWTLQAIQSVLNKSSETP